ncbi:MAG: hypothetical protein MUF75_01360 [Bacteroidia bacterium]|jgi:hypothetical protein|nr:hypothetical protein [Bacteroidia bacterium]
MPGKATLIFGLAFWSFLHAQELVYSRLFPTVSKNLPILIQNSPHAYFYVLRYNRKAHDVTLERRAKSGGEIISFTPLKLDSVNSDIFNYSNLEYRLFEHNYFTYFVFEKSLNNKKVIYFKRIDSLGKTGGFTEICRMERDPAWRDFKFELAGVFDGKLLIIATQTFFNQTTKKTVMVYDPERKHQIWSKNLPLENALTGYSKGFCLSPELDLFYVMVKAQIVSYQRKYIKHAQIMVPVMYYDSLHLHKLPAANQNLQRKYLLGKLNALHSLQLSCDSGNVRVLAQVSAKQADSTQQLMLFGFKCSITFFDKVIANTSPLRSDLTSRLTYYDGTDFDQAADKEFEFLSEYSDKEFTYHLTERKEGDVYKELILWKIRNSGMQVVGQYLIPRRMLSSETWSRYTNIGQAGIAVSESKYRLFMAEAPANVESDPNSIRYYQLKKKASLANCYLMLYSAEADSKLLKQKLHYNATFDFIPIPYKSSQTEDAVFYFTNGKQEKFALLEF